MNILLRHTGTPAVIIAFSLLLIFLCIYMLTRNLKSERQLLAANKRYLDLINNIQGGVITCVFDKKTGGSHALYVNDGWSKLTGYTVDELNQTMGGNPQSLVLPEDLEATNRDYVEQTSHGNTYKLQYRILNKSGNLMWVIDRGVVTADAVGNPQNQSIITEVTEIKENEAELLRLSQTDPLTGLYNKVASSVLAADKLKQTHGALHALMVLDIDNFKGINDSLGHIFGDTVLTEVSSRLRHLMGSNDIVGRIGGDEFMVLMSDIGSRKVAERRANDICATFRSAYSDENESCKISCSIGIAFSADGIGLQELFAKADNAMYQAKAMGKDQYLVYSVSNNDNPFLDEQPVT